MAFSGALTLTDLNDFITPSQACIKPVEQTNGLTDEQKRAGAAATEILIDSSGGYYEVAETQGKPKARTKLQTAEISLNDCLACSGCITSAESVLITLQSHVEVLSFLSSNPPIQSPYYRLPVLSIAPQSLASLSTSISTPGEPPIPLQRILNRIRAFCAQKLGIPQVYDTTFARHVALLEHRREFMERKACGQGKLPMLASACPGWVCYAEKAHAEMLPFMSRTKSPQQVMGTLIKEWMGNRYRRSPDQIYHVTVMPCYDKKLEASRKDFYNEAYSTRDVDCVLTTGELSLMMKEQGWDLSIPVPDEDISPPPSNEAFPAFPDLLSHPGTSSGSYLHDIISTLSSTISSPSLSVRTVRSSDYEEYTLTDASTFPERVIFKGAKCYGFRNLQNVVRKVGRDAGVQVGRGAAFGKMTGGVGVASRGIRRSKATVDGIENPKGYDYVEVMACPGGCVNGGGQVRPEAVQSKSASADEEGFTRDWETEGVSNGIGDASSKWGDKEWIKRVEAAYWNGVPTPPPSPSQEGVNHLPFRTSDLLALGILRDLCAPVGDVNKWSSTMDDEAEQKRRRLFQTEYRAVESEVVGLAVKW